MSSPRGLVTAVGAIVFGLGSSGDAETGRLLQGAGSAFSFTGAVYLASHRFSRRYLATAVGFTQCFGMLGGSAGQFAVGPMIHGLDLVAAILDLFGPGLLVLAAVTWISTPSGHDVRPVRGGSLRSMFKPFKIVLTNPQSYLCGFSADFCSCRRRSAT